MNELQIFNSEEFGQVRTVLIDNEPYFVGKDVAAALGYINPQDALKNHIDSEDKKMGEPNATPYIIDSLGRKQYPTYINESGLYSLVFGSKLETAKKFKHWVTSEVLPTLRKTGSYEIPKKKSDKPKKEKLPSVNMMVKNIREALHDAGVDSKYIAAEVVRIYSDSGYPVNVPLVSDVPKLWDCTSIAKELGIYSESGRPHDKAVSAIIQKLDLFADEIVRTAYSRNGHDGVTVQYKDSVLKKAREWLEENNYPLLIEFRLANGSINKCRVYYGEVA